MTSARRMIVLCGLVTAVGGLIFGYAIGFVPIYTTFNGYNTNCPKLLTATACNSVEHASCVWVANSTTGTSKNNDTSGRCLFNDWETVQCELYLNQSSCSSASNCNWQYSDSKCVHEPDWSAVKTGVFASAMIAGGMFGSMLISPVLDKYGRKGALYVTAAVALISCALSTSSRVAGSYILLIVARLLIGVASGSTCVVCPMYAEEMAPTHTRHAMVVLFQIGITFGIFLASLLGLVLEPSDFSDAMHMELRFQLLNLFQWIVSICLIPVAIIIPESNAWLNRTDDGVPDEASPVLSPDTKAPSAAVSNRSNSVIASADPERQKLNSGSSDTQSMHTLSDLDRQRQSDKEAAEEAERKHKAAVTGERRTLPLWVIVLVSLVLSASQQFTGINAVMNYAPNIMAAAGLQPLMGNFLVMLWNFLSSIAAIPFSNRFSPRKLYLVGTLVASIACLVNGIPVYPGLLSGASATVRHVIAGIGIFVFIAAFEIAMGPVFYMLAVEMFPVRHRSLGCAFTNMTQFVMNILVNLCFPILVVAFSGGPDGNQDKGMGLMFILFGVTGLASLPPMVKWLYPAEKENVVTTFEEAVAAE